MGVIGVKGTAFSSFRQATRSNKKNDMVMGDFM
jgi:hypothetical protein